VELESGGFTLTLLDDATYEPGSADNLRQYDREYSFVQEYRPVSKHGLICRQPDGTTRSCILLAVSATRIHEHSAVVTNDACFVGVGGMLCSLSLPTLDLRWATKVDTATCFGVYFCPQHECLLTHGELEIARVCLSGEIVWATSGKDIFSEGFRILGDYIEAVDFNHEVYRIDIVTGRSKII
jgi:hypothetical protein